MDGRSMRGRVDGYEREGRVGGEERIMLLESSERLNLTKEIMRKLETLSLEKLPVLGQSL